MADHFVALAGIAAPHVPLHCGGQPWPLEVLLYEGGSRMYCDYQQTDWASILPLAEFSCNNSKYSATSLTPFSANYGFHPSMSLLPPSPSSRTPAADSYVQRLREAREILQVDLLKAHKAMEVSANRRRRPAPNLIPG